MPQDNQGNQAHQQNGQNGQNGQQNGQSSNYNNASSGHRNGIAYASDPMSPDSPNVFAMLDSKSRAQSGGNGNNPQPSQNQYGMPMGSGNPQQSDASFQNPQPAQGSGSPMDRWLAKPDNGSQPANSPAQAQAPAEASSPYQSPFASTQLAEFQGVLGKRDFVGDMFTPEVQTAFQGGDFSKLPDMINAAVQQGAAMSSFLSSRFADKGVSSMMDNFQSAILPGMFKEHQLSNVMQAPEMADFNSPAMQPMMNMALSHVRGMFPNAAPHELRSKAIEMVGDMSKQLSGMNYNTASPTGNSSQQSSMTEMEMLFKPR
jgi:hypothetical protein